MTMSGEVTYFSDPQLDRAIGLIWQLAAELHLSTQRCRALEALLVRHNVLEAGELDAFAPQGDETAAFDAARDEFMRRLLRVLTEDGPAAHPLRAEARTAG